MQLAMALLLSIGCSPAKPTFHSLSADNLLRLELPSHPTFCRHAAPPYRLLVVCSSTSRQRCRIPKLSSFHPSLYALAALAVNLCHAASSFAVCFGNLVLWRRLWLQAVKNAIDHGWQADVKEPVARRGGRAGDAQVRGPNWSEGLGRTCLGKALEWCGSQEETHAAGSSPMQQGGLGMALLSTTAIAKDHINPVLATLSANPTFMSGLLAWAIAQVLKFFTTFFVEKRWDFKMLLGSGGMPSSHSALCVALTTSVALSHGISDALFPVCLGFSLIVMYDATGVRRHAGMQAEVLNMIVEDLFEGHPISEKKLKELLGHTPLQVFAGACLGMMVGYLCSQGYPVAHGNGI